MSASLPEDEPLSSQQTGTVDGVVVRSTGSYYEVQTADGIVRAVVRGRFRLDNQVATNPVAVGDHVSLRLEADTGLIVEIKPRFNKLYRRAAGRRVGVQHVLVANVDFAWVVQSVLLPKINPGFVDRFLVMAGIAGVKAGVIINKADLLTDAIRDAVMFWKNLYEQIGYPVLVTSAKTGVGVNALAATLPDKTTVLSGPSGVGKSSLINAVEPEMDVATGKVSAKTRKGRHITAQATLYTLRSGGRLVDTPGLREFGVIDVVPSDLGQYFPDFIRYLNNCRYPNCTHDHEPDCAVVDAVASGDITEVRWASYLNILASVRLGDRDVGR